MSDKNIVIEQIPGDHIENHRVELVERKGVGHPDSLADGISEEVSRALCKEYRKEFGTIAHHNTDEVQIIGGKSSPEFEGGEMLEPIYVLLGGRATHEYDGDSVDVHRIAKQAAKEYLDSTVRHLDVEEHIELESRIGKGSSDLTEMYARGGELPLANDTSFGIGHAPLSESEKTVIEIERYLNSERFKEDMPFVGEDVKVMGSRVNGELHLTVAAAFVDSYVENKEDYRRKKDDLNDIVKQKAHENTERSVRVDINTADGEDKDELYLTVTGTSAEMGDDGSTGRGNRVSGLITPKRSMSLEASSGKNPVAHIGKIYNIMSHYIADQTVEALDNVDEAHVKLLSQIGTRIDQPQIASVQVATKNGLHEDDEKEIEKLTSYWLENAPEIMDKVIEGDITTF
ncbi:MAG: methionine adenosyltransferase [Candidatus Nanohaloarchaeota archaeon QJJ-7]|nr:methionine adenosyltransferase [Candidatus Nanohaloarchaeota archaeon QJJ-7]